MLAAAAAAWNDETHVEASRALYIKKFEAAEAALKGKAGYKRPKGGFYLWLDVGDGEAFAKRLWREQAVMVLPGAYIGETGAGRASIPASPMSASRWSIRPTLSAKP